MQNDSLSPPCQTQTIRQLLASPLGGNFVISAEEQVKLYMVRCRAGTGPRWHTVHDLHNNSHMKDVLQRRCWNAVAEQHP